MDTTTTQLTETEKRIKIAEACGAKWMEDRFGNPALAMGDQILCLRQREDGDKECLTISFSMPDYFTDLNAMHEAEKSITDWDIRLRYASYIGRHDSWGLLTADPERRAECFGKALNLWP